MTPFPCLVSQSLFRRITILEVILQIIIKYIFIMQSGWTLCFECRRLDLEDIFLVYSKSIFVFYFVIDTVLNFDFKRHVVNYS